MAVWVNSPRRALADVATLQQTITSRLAYQVLRCVESQVVSGDGAGEHLTGLLNSGIGSVEYNASELAADQTLEGLIDVLEAECVPNAILISPRDLANMRKQRATGTGESRRVLQRRAVSSQLVHALGRADDPDDRDADRAVLVDEFAAGATLLVREGVQVRLSDTTLTEEPYFAAR